VKIFWALGCVLPRGRINLFASWHSILPGNYQYTRRYSRRSVEVNGLDQRRPILEGPQDTRKSTALKTLAGPYITDELADLGSKDSALQTRGVWIIELSKLDTLSRAEVSRIKAFISRTTDRFRPRMESG
jgi:hypothetical protein